jgi:hypothetical protein
MNWTIDAKDWARNDTSPILDGSNPLVKRPSLASVVSMSLGLTTAGRLGFFIDYSELSDAGTHTFYVCRTHGSTGAVSVQYSTGGDTHSIATGSLSWADGELDIKSFTVAVTPSELTTHQTTDGLGEHRIWALLSNPTNGAELHFGTEITRAYGVIDNNVVASDANAVFYDSAAVSVGTGTQVDPYNNAVTAIQNIGNKRYLYGRGTTLIDNTYQPSAGLNGLPVPETRASESDRVYVRNWGASTWSIQGTAAATVGFSVASASNSHCTYRGIDFSNLNSAPSGSGGSCYAIQYLYGGAQAINIELCTVDTINGGGNTAAFNLWGVDGSKVWRCVGSNITRFGLIFGANSAVVESYDGKNISVQRCEGSNANYLVHHKRVGAAFDVSTSVRFCKDATLNGVLYGRSGSSGAPHSYTIVQCNLFLSLGVNSGAIGHIVGTVGQNGSNNADKHWWCNNVIHDRGSVQGGDSAPVQFYQAYNAIIFNNIYLESQRLWRETQDSSAFGPVIEYADHELHFGTKLPSQTYEYKQIDYPDVAGIQSVRPDFAGNDVIADPLFTDVVGGDFTLQAGSPALTGGVDGTQQGLYLGNFYTIGANGLNPEAVSVVSMNLPLTTAGRLGFFTDYSERTTVGDHTFYLTRTHGSTGVVGCTWTAYDSADGSQLATGNASWADQSLDVLSFTVNVPSKPLGDHRIYVLLSSPTGGAVLHHGDSTVAYGIIDDNTIAASNAIFIDADSVTDGVGTQASPFNNWYSARDTVTVSTRYIYIKGLMIPDDTDNNLDQGNQLGKHFTFTTAFDGRISESQRLVIRNWPTFVGGISGGGDTNTAGFLMDGSNSQVSNIRYVTFKNLTATNLNNATAASFFVWTRSGIGQGIVEHITSENISVDGCISGSESASASAVWYSETASNLKMWRCDVQNADYVTDEPSRLHSFQCFRSDNVSIQRCTFGQTAGGVYEKEGIDIAPVRVGISMRFNVLDGPQMQFSTQGGIQSCDFHIIQNNIFSNTAEPPAFSQLLEFTMSSTNVTSTKQLISNNVFYNYDSNWCLLSTRVGWAGLLIYNNIFHEVDRAWRVSANTTVPEYANHNVFNNEVRQNDMDFFVLGPDSIPNLTTLKSLTVYEQDSIETDPNFTDLATGDFTLQAGSSALTSGISNTPQGAYLADFITIGAN